MIIAISRKYCADVAVGAKDDMAEGEKSYVLVILKHQDRFMRDRVI